MSQLKAIVIAAGEGSRMKSKTHKVLHKILGKPILEYELDALKKCSVSEIIAVVGSQADKVMESFPSLTYATQHERLGTGHAVMMAKEYLDDDSDCFVLYGDIPLITPECLNNVYAFHKENNFDATLTSTFVDNPFGYGRIIRKDNDFKRIVEQKDATSDEALVNEINVGIYCYKSKYLKLALSKLTNNNSQNEYYITDTLEILLNENLKVGVYSEKNADDFYGINTKVQLFEASKIFQKRINNKHMLNGVTIIDSDNTYIGQDVEIGADTVIYPGTIIEGKVTIGEDCKIGMNCKIENSKIGNSCNIESSIVLNSALGNNVSVGPFAYIRPDSNIGNNVKIGDFVEIKKSTIGDGTKASHLTYIGDASVGKNVNFGCGTVVVNYDGGNKNQTVVGDNVFIGCNTNLISPVEVKSGSYTAAGSTITENVPENTLAIARARQVNKIGWKRK